MSPIRALTWLLRFGGLTLVLAFPFIFLPTSSMAAIHDTLGIGPFPGSPLTEYLTRSISALYGFHGVLVLLVSTDVRRFRPIVILLGVQSVLFGLIIFAVDVQAGMPPVWILFEGPPILAIGIAIVLMARSIPKGP